MDQATAQQYLADAEAARHRLAMGAREVEIAAADGRRTTYALADMAALDAYISLLTFAAAPAGGVNGAGGRRPIGFRFGR
jgi:gpW